MRSLIGVLTYRRVDALKETLRGLAEHCSQYDTVVSEDCGQADSTEAFLANGRKALKVHQDLLATEYAGDHLGKHVRVLLGDTNLGVAGNSNRILKIFEDGCYDQLCLINDDLHILGDFVSVYARGHADLGVGLWCFSDFTHHESYRWLTVNSRGHRVKLLGRMTGIMMSINRPCFEAIGYYDSRFGKFGEEHVDYTIRARLAGFINLDGLKQNAMDLEVKPPVLKHQDVETSVQGVERAVADQEAEEVMKMLSSRYGLDPVYCPFRLRLPRAAAGIAAGNTLTGIPVDNLSQYHYMDVPIG